MVVSCIADPQLTMIGHASPFLSLDQLAEILSALPDPVFILTRSGRYAAIFGGQDTRYYHDGAGLVGRKLDDVLCAERAQWFLAEIARTLAEPGLRVIEYSLARQDVRGLEAGGPEAPIWFEGRVQRLHFAVDGEDAVLWVASNITERHDLEARLRAASETDTLTGLRNRRYFEQAAISTRQRALRYGHPVSLLIFDVDHFKLINDTCGHQVGDEVLAELAALVRSGVRESDALARWGGEEFVLMMPEIGLDTALLAAEHVRQTVEAHHFGHGLRITLSLGVAEWKLVTENLQDVVARADEALYRAKRTGRNRSVADETVGLADSALLRWRPEYLTGHALIDREHRTLFDATARLRRLAAVDGVNRPGVLRESLLTALARLREQLAQHFANEERLLESIDWPGLTAHRVSHAHELARIDACRAAFIEGREPPEVIARTLSREIANHMLGPDREFMAALVSALQA
ncbi:MAG: diguanylate cyclase [Candidatus Dactylopiibacterium sp.]|nr:diguanylate cyclase [Candidatus Dactylopiibacterium sp.]